MSLALAAPLLLTAAHAATAAPVAARPYDFDGDGFPDLVVSAPSLDVSSEELAGGLAVVRRRRPG